MQGTSASGDGVEGFGGGSGIGVYGQGGGSWGNGVQGYAGSAAGKGVFGVNVFGGTGIVGASDAAGGIGIRGEGAAVGVQAALTGSGVALDVQGPAKFSRSGTVVIPSGQKTATVTPTRRAQRLRPRQFTTNHATVAVAGGSRDEVAPPTYQGSGGESFRWDHHRKEAATVTPADIIYSRRCHVIERAAIVGVTRACREAGAARGSPR